MSSITSDINALLNDKLFQVIGSTPKSVAESLMKIDLKDKPKLGAEIFAISVFAAAVNKSTLESFLADPRFSSIRPSLVATMSINGRANMTALTLLGHCLLTTDQATAVNFTAEFRKKMGQNNIWDGELTSGSLSDKQKEILREKKRLTDITAAKTLGTGFMKLTGIVKERMNAAEMNMFSLDVQPTSSAQQGGATALSTTGNLSSSDPAPALGSSSVRLNRQSTVQVPDDVMAYRKNIMRQDDEALTKSIERNGIDKFIEDTRRAIAMDPDGTKRERGQSVVGSSK